MAHFEAIKLMLERKLTFPRDLFWIFPHDEEINSWAAQASVKIFRKNLELQQRNGSLDGNTDSMRP